MKKEKILKILIFAVVLLIPIIYSFFYLKSYWNPYGTLSDMKIAVVNLDNGKDDKNQGKEFVQSLKDSGTFNICEVSKENANDGMKKGDYYATIEIPENFTECLESGSTTDKQIAQITYKPNQATNYLATQIINSAVKTIELNLQSKVDREIIANLSSKLNEVPDSLQSISDGAGSILEGSQSLNDGIKQLNDGTNQLSSSYKDFDNGVESAYTGCKNLESGLSQVSTGVDTLKKGGQTLDSAISQINAGVDELSAQSNSGIASLVSGVNNLNTGAIVKGMQADYVVVDNLNDLNILKTYVAGKCVFDGENVLFDVEETEFKNTFDVSKKESEDFEISCDEPSADVNVIRCFNGELITEAESATLETKNGFVQPDLEEDILKIAVVERYGGNSIANGFITGFNLKKGAIASSVAHDSHNIVVVGTNSEDMANAVNCLIDNEGGFAIVDGDFEDSLALPIAGLMTNEDSHEVAEKLEKLHKTAADFGCKLDSPFMTMSFMALLVIPAIKISDKGLFDCINFEFIDVIKN